MRSSLLLTALASSNSLLPESPCFSLKQNFRGIFRDGDYFKSLFTPVSSECLFESTELPDSGHISDLEGDSQLVWLERKAVDASIDPPSFRNDLDAFLDHLTAEDDQPSGLDEDSSQVTMSQTTPTLQLHYRSPDAALISLDLEKALSIDTRLPRFWKSTLVSPEPQSLLPVPSDDVKRVEDILARLKFDPEVASIVNSLSLPLMVNDIAYLTGESSTSNIISRHAFAEGSRVAVAWLKERFQETGAACEFKPFLTGFSPSLVCKYTGTENTNTSVILGAHYDSRGSFGSTRAPGGDDDGSGTTALLAIARAIKAKRIQFHSNVELAAFSGEEQGLLGSSAYARELREAGANVTLMIQADMLAYHSPDEPMQLGLPDIIGTPAVTQLVANVSKIYSPELTVGFTPACCSDHQSFHTQGFAASQVFERAGPILDPMYHNSGDLSQRHGYDFNQLKAIAKVQFATVLHAAGFDYSE